MTQKFETVKSIHLIGVAGTGMGSFAGLLKAAGYTVRGSDENVYSPMKEKLQEWEIPVLTPYNAANLIPKPDLVIVGNAIRKENVEATRTVEENIAHTSFPKALGELFLSRNNSIVVSGTHGKTTSCSLLAHAFAHNKIDSGFLIGGIPNNFSESFRTPKEDGAFFVVEGDEYDTAYFDKGPKFLHYKPRYLLATSLEYDHADIYDNVGQIIARFTELFSLLPPDGSLVVHANSAHLAEALDKSHIRCNLLTYGQDADYIAENVDENQLGVSFDIIRTGENLGRVFLRVSGNHNIQNALGCYAILTTCGLSHAQISDAYASFEGVKRRMEVKGQVGDVLVIDDFAHHPTAVQTTLEGARRKFAGRPLWALFEPRSASSCRKVFQDAYSKSFTACDRLFLAPSGRALDPAISINLTDLADAIATNGTPAKAYDSLDLILREVTNEIPSNAVILCMSNGSFGNIHHRIIEALKEKTKRAMI